MTDVWNDGWISSLLNLPPPIQIFFLLSTLHLTNSVLTPILSSLLHLLELLTNPIPTLTIPLTPLEAKDEYTPLSPTPTTPLLSPTPSPPSPTTRLTLRDPSHPHQIQCFDPSTLHHLGQVPALAPADVSDLCARARRAQIPWSRTTFVQRRLVMRTIQAYILEHMEDIARVCARDSGKPKLDAALGEIMTTCEKIRWVLADGERILRRSYRPSGPMMMHKRAYVEYVPLGVLGVIAPWNYPFHNMLNHVISGLFAGNAVVSKVSEHTSWSSSYFTRIVRAALEVHGFDGDVVQTVTGFGEAGRALVEGGGVDKVIFTGSPGVGRMVMEGCSKNLVPVVLELGGKDPMVFCEDVDIDSVIPWAMRGCYQNSGQNCCGVERIFLYSSIQTEFLSKIIPRVQSLQQSTPLTTASADGTRSDDTPAEVGSMVMDAQIDLIQDLVDDAVKHGAVLHCGGKRKQEGGGGGGGQFYEPTVLSGITPSMRIFKEEVFGPVMSIITVPNDSDSECIRLINSCRFGLGSSVYCKRQSRGMAIGRQIRSGMFTVNDFGSNYMIQSLPFGGVNESGFGRFAGEEGLRGCCLERSMVEDRIWGVRTSIPGVLKYPIQPERAMGFVMGLLRMFYCEGVGDKVRGIWALIRYG